MGTQELEGLYNCDVLVVLGKLCQCNLHIPGLGPEGSADVLIRLDIHHLHYCNIL